MEPFNLPVSEGMLPGDYWDVLYSETALSSTACSCSFPATTASVERLWSLVGYTQEGRERMTPEHSFEELHTVSEGQSSVVVRGSVQPCQRANTV